MMMMRVLVQIFCEPGPWQNSERLQSSPYFCMTIEVMDACSANDSVALSTGQQMSANHAIQALYHAALLV